MAKPRDNAAYMHANRVRGTESAASRTLSSLKFTEVRFPRLRRYTENRMMILRKRKRKYELMIFPVTSEKLENPRLEVPGVLEPP